MLPFFFGLLAAASLGPMGNDAAHTPQLATNGNTVGLAFGAGNAIYYSSSHDAGKNFSQPVKVAAADIVPLTRHRGPRVVFVENDIIITAVMGKTPSHEQHAHGLPSDGDLIAWRSIDDGKTWSKGTTINDVPGASTEGLHALATDGKATVFAAWLDKHGGKGTQLYSAISRDRGKTWSKKTRTYASPEGTICECCHPSAAIDANGDLLVMWRNWLGGARDMYVARAHNDQFGAPVKLGTGTWKLNACPMDGGGIAIAHGQIYSAWRRENTVYTSQPDKPEVAVGQGKDVAAAVSPNGMDIAWMSTNGIMLRRAGSTEAIAIADTGAYPAIATLANGTLVVAWEDNGAIKQKSLPSQ
jgi:hypothetical protein